jgi:septum formation protein
VAEPRLVLASGSPRRADLLARLGLDPEIRPAAVDETPLPGEPPLALVIRLADAKARAVQHPAADEVILAADTMVVLDDEALGKPRDDTEAAGMLRRLSGRTHEVLTALAVHRGHRRHAMTVTTAVRFRALTDLEVA